MTQAAQDDLYEKLVAILPTISHVVEEHVNLDKLTGQQLRAVLQLSGIVPVLVARE